MAPDHDGLPEPTPRPTPRPGPGPGPAPASPSAQHGSDDGPTGDPAVDGALQALDAADPDDLDAQIEAGTRVHHTLQGRLSDLGGA